MQRAEIQNLFVGQLIRGTHDTVPFSAFTQLKPDARWGYVERIVSIDAVGDNIHGKAYCCFTTTYGDGASITGSIAEGEQTYRLCSLGHVAFVDDYEYYTCSDQLYKAPVSAVIMPNGYRSGRWECTLDHAKNYPSVYPFLLQSAYRKQTEQRASGR